MDRFDDRTPLWDYSDNRYPDGNEGSGRWSRARAEEAARTYVATEDGESRERDRYSQQRPRDRYDSRPRYEQRESRYGSSNPQTIRGGAYGAYGRKVDYDRYAGAAGDARGGERYDNRSASGWPAEFGYPPAPGYAPYGDRSRFPSDYDENDRGFFERAGDEVLSWFGDREARHRREQDHRGRGPKNYARSDERIREDVNDRLTEDVWIDASEIDVTVAEGEVTLVGSVEDRRAKRRAEDIADDVSGVKHVQNNLRYTSGVVSPKID